GPSDTVPPNIGGTGDGTPGNPGNPTTPGPGPTTGSHPGPSTPGRAPPSTAPGPRGTGPGLARTKNKGSTGYDQWHFCARHTDDPSAARRGRMLGRRPTSQASLQRGVASNADLSRRPTPSDVSDTIVPALLSVLDSNEADLVDSAVLALARVLPAEKSAVAL